MSSSSAEGAPNSKPALTRLHWTLIGIVVAGAVTIAAIGFSGSYTAVRDLAEDRGFGAFAPFFPIGIDAGILVLLALDLLLTWIRIPFPLLRQTAWLLTAATIAFNGAAAWPDPLGVGMHAVIPVLFVVAVEAARHAVGRIADITADRHMDGVRISRWLLAFPSTFLLWRRMKLWEMRSYEHVVRMEQDRCVYQARLRARYGRNWRRKAPVDAMTPLRLARYGVPLALTGPAGLKSAGITTPVTFFADIDTGSADKARTNTTGAERSSADADTAPRTLSASLAPGADNSSESPALSPMSARTSAPAGDRAEVVRADNGGRPEGDRRPQVGARSTDQAVRPDIASRPSAALPAEGSSAPDKQQAVKPGADNPPEEKGADNAGADKAADISPLAADNGADRPGPDNGKADKRPPRGALADGVRKQMSIGVTDPDIVTDRLREALGLNVDRKSVARVIRREQQQKGDAAEPVPGQYL